MSHVVTPLRLGKSAIPTRDNDRPPDTVPM